MAHKKAGGSTALGRDSHGQRLGVKVFGGSFAHAGGVLVRQRGARFRAGINVRVGSDDTLYAIKDGIVRFQRKQLRAFSGKTMRRNIVHVEARSPASTRRKK